MRGVWDIEVSRRVLHQGIHLLVKSVGMACKYMNISNVYYYLYLEDMSLADENGIQIPKTVFLNCPCLLTSTYSRTARYQQAIETPSKLTSIKKYNAFDCVSASQTQAPIALRNLL